MAVVFPGSFKQASGETNSAVQMRQVFESLVGEGVASLNGSDDYKVSEDTGSDMKVSVALGFAWVTGDQDAPTQGRYGVFNDGPLLVTVPASDLTNDRIDLVVLQVHDTFYGDGDDIDDVIIVEGTPDPVPIAPDLPDSALLLAEIAVGAGVTAIHDADITDRRSGAGAGGAVVGCRVSRDGGDPQSVANNAAENASFNAPDDWDSDGYHDDTGVTLNRTIIQVPAGRAGVHRVHYGAQFDQDPDGRRRLRIILNGAATRALVEVMAVSGGVTGLQVFDLLDLADGDQLQCELFHTAGGALDVLNLFGVVERVGSAP